MDKKFFTKEERSAMEKGLFCLRMEMKKKDENNDDSWDFFLRLKKMSDKELQELANEIFIAAKTEVKAERKRLKKNLINFAIVVITTWGSFGITLLAKDSLYRDEIYYIHWGICILVLYIQWTRKE